MYVVGYYVAKHFLLYFYFCEYFKDAHTAHTGKDKRMYIFSGRRFSIYETLEQCNKYYETRALDLPFCNKLLLSNSLAWCKQDDVRTPPSRGICNGKLGTCKINTKNKINEMLFKLNLK